MIEIPRTGDAVVSPLSHVPGDGWDATQVGVFEEIFLVFLLLGTAVGVIVIGYMLYNAHAYRAGGAKSEEVDVDRPQLGELPSGGAGGKKLFLSFAISAVIVVSLVAWTYTALLYVETGPQELDTDDNLDVEVVGGQFYWEFHYPDGHEETNEMYVPVDQVVSLEVTAAGGDVWHAFGAPELRVKADAIPGQTSHTWFEAEETGEYRIECFELCGSGHSGMDATMYVLDEDDWDAYEDDPEAFKEEYHD